VPGTHQIIITGNDAAGFSQVFLYDTDTGSVQQLTQEKGSVSGAMMWRAPEYDNAYIFFAVVNAKTLVVYRQLPDAHGLLNWQAIQRTACLLPLCLVTGVLRPQRALLHLLPDEPEPGGLDAQQPVPDRHGGCAPGEQHPAEPHPNADVVRMRMDPEYYITAQGPFIYYNRFQAQGPASPATPKGCGGWTPAWARRSVPSNGDSENAASSSAGGTDE
jgi:hypothetical protein